jgi:hypothetical protein
VEEASLSELTAAWRKTVTILREEGGVTWLSRAARAAIVRARRSFRNDSANIWRWSRLRGRFAGQRAFLVGNGPSLNLTPLHLLRHERTMCFNRFDLMFERLPWRPTMYAVIDDRVARDTAELINATVQEVELAFFPDLHPYNVDFTRFIEAAYNVYWLHLDSLSFRDDLPRCGINKTVANVGLQILAYLGFTKIYLLGVDLEYQRKTSVMIHNRRDLTATADDDPDHFDPRYFGVGRKYHQPRMEETVAKFRQAREFFQARGVQVVNAGVGGRLDLFERVDLRSVLPEVDSATELSWLLEPVGVRPVGRSLAETFPHAPRVSGPSEWDARVGEILASAAVGATIVPRAIFTHVPLGPFRDEYVFVRRARDPHG